MQKGGRRDSVPETLRDPSEVLTGSVWGLLPREIPQRPRHCRRIRALQRTPGGGGFCRSEGQWKTAGNLVVGTRTGQAAFQWTHV